MLLFASIAQSVKTFFDTNPAFAAAYTSAMRYLFPALALFVLFAAVLSLFHLPKTPEVWAKLRFPDGSTKRIRHWENLLGRSPSADLTFSHRTVSRLHAVLSYQDNGRWMIYDLGSGKYGVTVNAREIEGEAPVRYHDTIGLGDVSFVLEELTPEEQKKHARRRRQLRPLPPWSWLILLTFFQFLTSLQLMIASTPTQCETIFPVFLLLSATMWCYFLVMRLLGNRGFELELIAFFLTTLSFSVTGSSNPSSLFKQWLAVLLGIVLFVVLGFFMRDLGRSRKIRWVMAGAAIGLMFLTLLLGQLKYGATNWIQIGSFSFQPSELAKLCYIFAGSATLDRLFRKRNLGLFMLLSFVLIASLGLMNDFGTAAIFFITFLVIAYLRSGDFATLLLVCAGAASGGFLILLAKPYIWARFSVWRHAWDYASSGGYQQVRTMSAAASGGLFGVGAGNGWLHRVAAADTDLVFGMLCEEWGVLLACIAVFCILMLALYTIRTSRISRSSFYTIAACSATSMLVFQTALNVFGSLDILPLTGVTLPFVSNGGSSMLLSWGLLAFLKTTDVRPGASFAIRKQNRKGGHI